MTGSPIRAVGRLLATAAATRACYQCARAAADATQVSAKLARANYRGHRVDLLGGPALGVVVVAGALLDRALPTRVRAAAAIAAGASAVAGGLDDALGSSAARGFRGHLAALRAGEVTTGAAKIAVIGAAGAVAGCLVARDGVGRRLAGGAVVALSANLANLLDLRPGRALKSALAVGLPLAASSESIAARRIAALSLGAAAGLLPVDLRERTMLGDAGANCLGAVLGVAAITDAPGRRVGLVLAGLAGLTAASEFVSFSSVIEKSAVLRAVDRFGRCERG